MWGLGLGASLDHAVWFHQPPRFDDWVLYDMTSPVATAGRGLCHGGGFLPGGTRVASGPPEGVFRVSPPRPRARRLLLARRPPARPPLAPRAAPATELARAPPGWARMMLPPTAVIPPSTTSALPVTKRASSLAR